MKRRDWESSRGTSRLHHLPSLSPCPQPPQPPSTATLYAANLKDEALYLASILRARLSDSAIGGDGRGLLSRALARGELDQFLVAFFTDPANLLFAREQVGRHTSSITATSTCMNALEIKFDGILPIFVGTPGFVAMARRIMVRVYVRPMLCALAQASLRARQIYSTLYIHAFRFHGQNLVVRERTTPLLIMISGRWCAYRADSAHHGRA